ncbi:MAG TPA: hypothetical protein VIV58_20925 [Kofleriaceae bacterium]
MSRLSIPALVASLAVFGMFGMRGDAAPLANDRYGHMHMLFEKTWFGIDVARVDVWFDPATRDRFRELAAGQRFSDQVAERVALTALQAQDVDVQVEFLRDVSLGEFFDAARDNLVRARKAGYISNDTFAIAWRGVQTDFAALAKRGLKEGDRLTYRARADSLQTIVTSGKRVLLDVTSRDLGARRSMIASYFAPKSDFRTGLIKSLF